MNKVMIQAVIARLLQVTKSQVINIKKVKVDEAWMVTCSVTSDRPARERTFKIFPWGDGFKAEEVQRLIR